MKAFSPWWRRLFGHKSPEALSAVPEEVKDAVTSKSTAVVKKNAWDERMERRHAPFRATLSRVVESLSVVEQTCDQASCSNANLTRLCRACDELHSRRFDGGSWDFDYFQEAEATSWLSVYSRYVKIAARVLRAAGHVEHATSAEASALRLEANDSFRALWSVRKATHPTYPQFAVPWIPELDVLIAGFSENASWHLEFLRTFPPPLQHHTALGWSCDHFGNWGFKSGEPTGEWLVLPLNQLPSSAAAAHCFSALLAALPSIGLEARNRIAALASVRHSQYDYIDRYHRRPNRTDSNRSIEESTNAESLRRGLRLIETLRSYPLNDRSLLDLFDAEDDAEDGRVYLIRMDALGNALRHSELEVRLQLLRWHTLHFLKGFALYDTLFNPTFEEHRQLSPVCKLADVVNDVEPLIAVISAVNSCFCLRSEQFNLDSWSLACAIETAYVSQWGAGQVAFFSDATLRALRSHISSSADKDDIRAACSLSDAAVYSSKWVLHEFSDKQRAIKAAWLCWRHRESEKPSRILRRELAQHYRDNRLTLSKAIGVVIDIVPKLAGLPLEAASARELRAIEAALMVQAIEFAPVLEIWDAVCEVCNGQRTAWERLSRRAIKEAAKKGTLRSRIETLLELALLHHHIGLQDMALLVAQVAFRAAWDQPVIEQARLTELVAERVRPIDPMRSAEIMAHAAQVSGELSSQGRLHEDLRHEAEQRAGRSPHSGSS